MHRTANALTILVVALSIPAEAQLATVGGGVLLSNRVPEPVAELHAETPPIVTARVYGTVSWTDESAKPTLITAAERSVLDIGPASVGLGGGLVWLEGNDYRPYPIVVSSTVVRLPVPRTAVVAIASAQPFQDFEWTLVIKVGITVWFVR